MTDFHQRLQRLLFLVPYVVRNQGVPLRDLCQRLAISEEELLGELDFLLMIGRPPFQPNDFLDIYQEGGRVYVDLHQSLEKPPRLTVFEALALACAAQIFLGEETDPGETATAVRQAVGKVVKSLPDETRALFEQLSGHYLILSGTSRVPHLESLRRAVDDRLEVEIRHAGAGRGEESRRVVRPFGLHHRQGVWYLAAYCTQRKANRVFRLSRIRDVRLTDCPFDRPADFDTAAFVEQSLTVPREGQREVVIRFAPESARWVQERWRPEYLCAQPDGSVIVRLHDVSDEFVLSYVASFAGRACIEKPLELAERLRQQAREGLALYGGN